MLRCDHRLCYNQRLLKLKVCVIGLRWTELRKIYRRLARNLLGDRRQVGARPHPGVGRAALVGQHVVQIDLPLGIEMGFIFALRCVFRSKSARHSELMSATDSDAMSAIPI
jgi:hypothetical protein